MSAPRCASSWPRAATPATTARGCPISRPECRPAREGRGRLSRRHDAARAERS
ncbi:MAG: hypothetical protein MZV70_06405 [Desulfobacterales bacterium]|nr:hypothetical protein [Desulfobacterales bacterium]